VKRSKFSEAQILKALNEMEVRPAAEVARKLGVAPATLYQWKSRYGGMTLSELKRLRELEGENSRLKRRYAELERPGIPGDSIS
jgi:putative transposase